MSNLKSVEQGRATFAYQCVEEAKSIRLKNEYDLVEFKDFFKDLIIERQEKFLGKERNEDVKALKQKLFDEFDFNGFLTSKTDETEKKYQKELEKLINEFSKKYKSNVKNLPMYIKTNGLGATFAFVLSKSGNSSLEKKAWFLIYYQMKGWLKNHKKYLLDGKENEDLVKILIQLDSSKYRAVTIEVLAFFNWLRRFAEGLIEGDNEN
jgi:CRISPR-associated protein Cmr5